MFVKKILYIVRLKKWFNGEGRV